MLLYFPEWKLEQHAFFIFAVWKFGAAEGWRLFLKCSSSIWKILTDVGDGLPRSWNNKNRVSLRLESICLFYSKFSSKTLLGRRVPDESLLYHSWLKRFTPNFVHSLCCEKKNVAFKSHLGEFLFSILVFFLLFSSRDFLTCITFLKIV